MTDQRGAAKAWIIAFVVLAGGGLALFIGVGCGINANACPFRSQPKQTSTDGATLFLANCAVCHGRQGQGMQGPSLVAGDGGSLTRDELVSWITHGKPLMGMPMYKRQLSALQIRAIAAFVESLRASPSPSPSPSRSAA